jgi:hypothetical protein
MYEGKGKRQKRNFKKGVFICESEAVRSHPHKQIKNVLSHRHKGDAVMRHAKVIQELEKMLTCMDHFHTEIHSFTWWVVLSKTLTEENS